MAEIDLKDTLERFAAEGTRGAGAPPTAAVRRRRRNRSIRRATALTVLAVALVAVTPPLWGLVRDSDDRVAPAGGQRRPAPAPGATVASAPSTRPPSTTAPSAVEPEGNSTPAGAMQTAAYFLRFELGFTDPVTSNFKRTGAITATVDVRPTLTGESTGQPGPVTVVSLQAEANGWFVTGTRTAEISVAGPKAHATVTSPVAVRGSAVAFEGTVQVEVKANQTGKDPVLGRGFVTGGGDVKRPFSGSIAYKGGGRPGWLVFFTDSAANGQVLEATVIPVDLG
jgi:hypothetical protein